MKSSIMSTNHENSRLKKLQLIEHKTNDMTRKQENEEIQTLKT
jgi:hypothetical protein